MRNAYTYRKIGMQKNIQTKIEENLLDKRRCGQKAGHFHLLKGEVYV